MGATRDLTAARLFLLACTLVLPAASAGIHVDGVIAIVVEDHHGSSCPAILSDSCPATFGSDGDLGSTTIDAQQSPSRVSVALNPEKSPVPLPEGFLPRYALHLEGDRMVLGWGGVYEKLVDAYAGIPQERPYRDAVGFELDMRRIGAYVYGPSPLDPVGPHGNRTFGFGVDDPDSEISSEHLGPFNEKWTLHFRPFLVSFGNLTCAFEPLEGCAEAYEGAVGTASPLLPDIRAGVSWESVGLATDPDAFDWVGSTRYATVAELPLQGSSIAVPPSPTRPQLDPSLTPIPIGEPLIVTEDAEKDGSRRLISLEDQKPPPTNDPPKRASTPYYALMGAVAAAAAIWWILGALYSRFASKDRLLQHATRVALLEALRDGVPRQASELCRQFGSQRTALIHHLTILERSGMIQCIKSNRRLLVTIVGRSRLDAIELEFTHPTRGPVLRVLRDHGGAMARADIHAALPEFPARTRNHAMKRLHELGLTASPSGRPELIVLSSTANS